MFFLLDFFGRVVYHHCPVFWGIKKIKIILDIFARLWDNRTIMLKVIMWTSIAFCSLFHWIGNDHQGWGFIIFLVLLPIIFLRFLWTMGEWFFGSLKLLGRFFKGLTTIF